MGGYVALINVKDNLFNSKQTIAADTGQPAGWPVIINYYKEVNKFG